MKNRKILGTSIALAMVLAVVFSLVFVPGMMAVATSTGTPTGGGSSVAGGSGDRNPGNDVIGVANATPAVKSMAGTISFATSDDSDVRATVVGEDGYIAVTPANPAAVTGIAFDGAVFDRMARDGYKYVELVLGDVAVQIYPIAGLEGKFELDVTKAAPADSDDDSEDAEYVVAPVTVETNNGAAKVALRFAITLENQASQIAMIDGDGAEVESSQYSVLPNGGSEVNYIQSGQVSAGTYCVIFK